MKAKICFKHSTIQGFECFFILILSPDIEKSNTNVNILPNIFIVSHNFFIHLPIYLVLSQKNYLITKNTEEN